MDDSFATDPVPPPTLQPPRVYVVPAVIALNVIMFLIVGLSGAGFDPDGEHLLRWGADRWDYTTGGQWWRLLTSAFLHFGVMHLLANMYALAVVGPLCERLFGSVFFGVLYFLSAILSGLASVWWDRYPVSAGASGAIFAVFGALIAFVSIHRASFPRGAARSVLQSAGIMVAFNVFYGLSQKGISNSAHLGGLASGLILGAIMARPLDPERRQRQTLLRAALGIGLGVAAVAVSVAIIPKSDSTIADLQADVAFADVRSALIADQDKVIAKFDKIEAQARKEKWQAEQLAQKIETEILPTWEAMIRHLLAVQIAPRSPSRPLYDLMLAYVSARRDGYVAYAKALRTDDPDDLARYHALMQQGNSLVEQINKLQPGQ